MKYLINKSIVLEEMSLLKENEGIGTGMTGAFSGSNPAMTSSSPLATMGSRSKKMLKNKELKV